MLVVDQALSSRSVLFSRFLRIRVGYKGLGEHGSKAFLVFGSRSQTHCVLGSRELRQFGGVGKLKYPKRVLGSKLILVFGSR